MMADSSQDAFYNMSAASIGPPVLFVRFSSRKAEKQSDDFRLPIKALAGCV